jgi:hypothetical protein
VLYFIRSDYVRELLSNESVCKVRDGILLTEINYIQKYIKDRSTITQQAAGGEDKEKQGSKELKQ